MFASGVIAGENLRICLVHSIYDILFNRGQRGHAAKSTPEDVRPLNVSVRTNGVKDEPRGPEKSCH